MTISEQKKELIKKEQLSDQNIMYQVADTTEDTKEQIEVYSIVSRLHRIYDTLRTNKSRKSKS